MHPASERQRGESPRGGLETANPLLVCPASAERRYSRQASLTSHPCPHAAGGKFRDWSRAGNHSPGALQARRDAVSNASQLPARAALAGALHARQAKLGARLGLISGARALASRLLVDNE